LLMSSACSMPVHGLRHKAPPNLEHLHEVEVGHRNSLDHCSGRRCSSRMGRQRRRSSSSRRRRRRSRSTCGRQCHDDDGGVRRARLLDASPDVVEREVLCWAFRWAVLRVADRSGKMLWHPAPPIYHHFTPIYRCYKNEYRTRQHNTVSLAYTTTYTVCTCGR
jgi:hypothetical protein